jgi:probable O-glycosylation ligase (exosortase A-associated)
VLRLAFVLAIIGTGLVSAALEPFYALVFYLWNAYFRPEQWVWNDIVAAMNLSLVIAAILLGKTLTSKERLRGNLRVVVLGVFFLQCLVSTLFAETPVWSQTYLIELSKTLMVSYLIVVLVTERARLRLALLVVALSLGLEGAKQGWVQILVHAAGPNTNEHPVLGDNNGVAQGMTMLVPIFALLAETARTRWERHTHRLLMLGVLFRGLTTYSRGGLLAALAMGAMKVSRSKNRFRVLLAVVIVGAIAVPIMPDAFWDRMETMTDAPEKQDDSAKGRLHFWDVAVDMAMARPFVGVGVNGFQTSYNRYDSLHGAFGRGRAVHSVWFGLLGELGLPGLSLFLLNLGLALWLARKIRAGAAAIGGELAELVPYANAIEMSLVAYAVAGSFLSAQYIEIYWHMIGFSIALSVIASEPLAEAARRSRPLNREHLDQRVLAISERLGHEEPAGRGVVGGAVQPRVAGL